MWKKRKSSTTFTFNGEKVFLAASQTLGTVFSYFQTSRIGLTQEEVEARQSLYGKNEVEHEQKKNPISTFIKAFIYRRTHGAGHHFFCTRRTVGQPR